MKVLYLSLDWSQLNYGALALGKGSVTLCNKNQAAQNNDVRVIYGIFDRFHYKIKKLKNLFVTYNFFCIVKTFEKLSLLKQIIYFSIALVGCKIIGHMQLRFQLKRAL